MQTYTVTINIEAFERRKSNTGLLHIFSGFLLIIKTVDWIKTTPPEKQWPCFLFLAAGFIFVLFGIWGKRLTTSLTVWNKRFFLLEILTFMLLSFLFIPKGKPVDLIFTIGWTILCGFFYHTETRIEKPAAITLTEQGVIIPGFITNHLLAWKQLESVVLRTDFLTINKKNNKYYQFEVAEENGESFIAEFNRYAAGKIE